MADSFTANWKGKLKYLYDLIVAGTATLPAGLPFPSTQVSSSDANTLDDYEEGTFTPGMSFGGGTTGITYTLQTADYTKIGNRVLFHAVVVLNSNGTSTGAAFITGLPFTASSNNSDMACAIRASSLDASIASVQAQVKNNTKTIELFSFASGTSTALDDTTVPDGANFSVSGHYHV